MRLNNAGLVVRKSGGVSTWLGNDTISIGYTANEWGIIGKSGSDSIFELGSTNQIAGWAFTNSKLYNTTAKVEIGQSLTRTDEYAQLGTIGTDKGLFVSGLAGNWVAARVTAAGYANLYAYKDSANEVAIGEDVRAVGTAAVGNFTFRIRVAGNDVIHTYDSTAKIAGWSIDSSYFWTGTKKTSDGYSIDGITLKSDGSLYSKNFYIASDGNAFFKGNLAVTSIPSLATLDDGLIALYRFDEGSGNVAINSVSNSYNATMNDVTYTPGKSGLSASFNGSTSYVLTGITHQMYTEDWTYSVWVNSDTLANNTTILEKGSDVNTSRTVLRFGPSGDIQTYIGGTGLISTSTGLVSANTWHHIVITFQSSNLNLKIYLDSALVKDVTTATEGTQSTPAEIILGDETGPSTLSAWAGKLDEFRYYNRVIAQSEVQALYLNPSGNTGGLISANQVKTGELQSTNHTYTSGLFTDNGTLLDLNNGYIRSKSFYIASDGSGALAGGNISWLVNGNTTIGTPTTASNIKIYGNIEALSTYSLPQGNLDFVLPFNEASTTAIDLISGLTTTAYGSPTVSTDSLSRYSIYVPPGTSGSHGLTLSSDISIEANEDFTFSLWLKLDTPQERVSFGLIGHSTAYASGRLGFATVSSFRANSGAFGATISLSSPVPLDQWAHLTITRSSGTLTIYLNGSSVGTGVLAGAFLFQKLGDSPNNSYYGTLEGKMDEVILYRRSLTASEVKTLSTTTSATEGGYLSASKIKAGVITSLNYSYTSGNYSTAGTEIDLMLGSIRSNQFSIDSDGNAFFKGTLTIGATNLNESNTLNTEDFSSGNVNHNANMTLVAPDGRPSGWYAAHGSAIKSNISYEDTDKTILKLYHASDTSIGVAGKAFRVDPYTDYTIRIRVKSNVASATGFYFRINELDAELPVGKYAISKNSLVSSEAVVEERTRQINIYDNKPITTSWVDYTFIYTPTTTALHASPIFFNWDGMGTSELHIELCEIIPNSEKKTRGAVAGWTISGTQISSTGIALTSDVAAASASIALGTLTGISPATTNRGVFMNGAGDILIKGSSTSDANYVLFDSSGLTVNSNNFSLTSTGSIGLGATTYALGDGVWISSTATNRFRVGNASAARMQWNDTDLQIYNSANNLVATFGGTNRVGGWSVGSGTTGTLSATNLVFTPGAANAAHILAGTGATAGGINAANAAGDIVFWSGATQANRAEALFRVTAAGAITATSGTIGGWILSADDLSNGIITFGNVDYFDPNEETGDF